jgi:hypothetical protein
MPRAKKRGRRPLFPNGKKRQVVIITRETFNKIHLIASAQNLSANKYIDDILAEFATSQEAKDLILQAMNK